MANEQRQTDWVAEVLSERNRQVGGDHYRRMGTFQPFNVAWHWLTPEEMRGFVKGSAIYYLAREGRKGGDEDLEKAEHILALYREMREKGAK